MKEAVPRQEWRTPATLLLKGRWAVIAAIGAAAVGFHFHRTWSLLIPKPRVDWCMFQRLRQALGGAGNGESSFVECRRCGTRLGQDAGTCSCCGSTDVARYDL